MKPISITIEGFNSFLEAQKIDFDKLTSNGIFGIFGPTGSGKSSIIDAITFALYGKIPRYEGSGGIKGVINTNSNKMNIKFEFSVHYGTQEKVYIIERHYIKKEDGTIKPPTGRLYEKISKEEKIIASKISEVTNEAVNIIGLGYEDFTRSVVLPQGKFSRFLMLENKERCDMLERIFNLEKYGNKLLSKINSEKNIQKDKLNEIKQELEFYGELTDDDIKNQQTKYEIELNNYNNLKNKQEEIKTYINSLNGFIELKKEYINFIKQKNTLIHEKENIEKKCTCLNNSKVAEKIFPVIKNLEDINKKIYSLEKTYKTKISEQELIKIDLLKKETSFEKASFEKNNKYPELLKQEINLKDAVRLKGENDIIINENNVLSKEYDNSLNNLNLLKNKNTEIENKILQIKNNLDSIIFEKEKIKINPDYRNKIKSALDNENNLILLNTNIKKEKQKHLSLKSQLDKTTIALNDINNKLNYTIKNLEEETNKLDNIKSNLIDDPDFVIEKKDNLNKKTLEFKDKNEKNIRLQNLLKEIDNLNDSINNYSIKLNETESHINNYNTDYDNIEKQIKIAENNEIITMLAEELIENNPCPVCGSLSHPNPAKSISDSIYDKLKEKESSIKDKLNKLLEAKQDYHIKVSSSKKLLKTLDEEKDKLIKYIDNYNFDKEKEYIRTEKDKIQNIVNETQKLNEEIKQSENIILEHNTNINKLKIEKAKFKESIQKDCDILAQIKENISNLEEEYENNKLNLEASKANLKIENLEEEYNKILSDEINRSNFEKEENSLRNKLAIENTEFESTKSKILELEKNCESLLAKINFKKESIEKQNILIEKISNGKNPLELLNKTQNEIKLILENYNRYKEELEIANTKKQALENDKLSIESELKSLNNIKSENETNLEQALKNSCFNNIDEVKRNLLSEEKQNELEKEILSYNEELKIVKSNLIRLKEKLKNVEISNLENEKEEKLLQLKNIDEEINLKNNLISELNANLINMKKNISRIKELIKNKKIEQHKFDLISELSSLMTGNHFVEFAAKKHLNYITKEASERLKYMSNGRYSLELNGVDFIIRDNFNGGALRQPRTLSGGEIFLTSLSLALALSSKIQLKNKAPLEIFFLDEGFGSLDSGLLDTVMNSLEMLHLEKINVGIITHVDELKNRIQSKVLVTPQKNGISGSKIMIE